MLESFVPGQGFCTYEISQNKEESCRIHTSEAPIFKGMGKKVEDFFMGVVECGKAIALCEAMAALED